MVTNVELKKEVDELRKLVDTLKKEVDSLRGRLNDLEGDENQTGTSKMSWRYAVVNGKISKPQYDIVNSISIEQKARLQKQDNIVIFGLEESNKVDSDERREDDNNAVVDIFKAIDIDESRIRNVIRLKKKQGSYKPAPLVVRVSYDRNSILKSASKLKNNTNYEKVFISPDLTPAQREFQKTLRDEVKKKNEEKKKDPTKKGLRYKIKNDRIVLVPDDSPPGRQGGGQQ